MVHPTLTKIIDCLVVMISTAWFLLYIYCKLLYTVQLFCNRWKGGCDVKVTVWRNPLVYLFGMYCRIMDRNDGAIITSPWGPHWPAYRPVPLIQPSLSVCECVREWEKVEWNCVCVVVCTAGWRRAHWTGWLCARGARGMEIFTWEKSPLYYTRAFLMATPRAHPVTRSLNLGYIDRFKGTEQHGFNGKDLL